MAALNLKDCRCVTDRNFQKLNTIYVKDKDRNIFIPWHRWNTQVINTEKSGFKYNFSYFSYDLDLTNNFANGHQVFHLPVEIPRLLCTKMIDEAEYDNIIRMLKSEDQENLQIVVTILRNYRKRRLTLSKQKQKTHGR